MTIELLLKILEYYLGNGVVSSLLRIGYNLYIHDYSARLTEVRYLETLGFNHNSGYFEKAWIITDFSVCKQALMNAFDYILGKPPRCFPILEVDPSTS